MTPSPRTTHQRDRRFARVRMLTRTIFVGSSVLSVGMVGYLASITKLHTTTTTPTTSAPVTTTTTCYTSPSGNTVCN